MTNEIYFYNRADQDQPAWQEEIWSSYGVQEVPWIPPVYSDVSCVFVDGEHVYGSPDCPHYNGVEDFGFEPGWTVLSK